MPNKKILSTLYSITDRFTDDEGKPLAFVDYQATNLTTGEKISGRTDENGVTERFSSNNSEKIEVYLNLDTHDGTVELHKVADDTVSSK